MTTSTCVAEYIGLSDCSKEAVRLKRLFNYLLGEILTHPIVVHSDNNGAISLAGNEFINRRNNHIDIKFHFERDVMSRGLVELPYVPTTEMMADIMTKPIGRVLFENFVV